MLIRIPRMVVTIVKRSGVLAASMGSSVHLPDIAPSSPQRCACYRQSLALAAQDRALIHALVAGNLCQALTQSPTQQKGLSVIGRHVRVAPVDQSKDLRDCETIIRTIDLLIRIGAALALFRDEGAAPLDDGAVQKRAPNPVPREGV